MTHLRIAWAFLILVLVTVACGPEAQYDCLPLHDQSDMLVLSENASLDTEHHTLTIAAGAEAAWYFYLAEGTRLSFDEFEVPDGAQSSLQIMLELDGFSELSVAAVTEGVSDGSFPLGNGHESPARLVIRGSAEEETDLAASIWRLVNPRICYPQTILESTRANAASNGAGQLDARPNIVVYLSDTLRRDHIGVYGGRSELTPNIDSLAADSVVFDQAVAQSPWTRPSVASLFTGLEPQFHGVVDRPDSLPQAAETLAERLREEGYFTVAVMGNGNASKAFGFHQGFDHYSRPGQGRNTSEKVTARTLEALASPDLREPFFMFIHCLDPHHPYDLRGLENEELIGGRPNEYFGTQEFLSRVKGRRLNPPPEEKESTRRLYQAEVAFVDREFGRIIDQLENMGLYDSSLVIFLSDHGEEFWEHGTWGHGETFFNEVIGIPLIVKPPHELPQRRISGTVQQIDLYDTIIDFAGGSVPTDNNARSLKARIMDTESGDPSVPPQALSHLALGKRRGVALTQGRWRLSLRGTEYENVELFDLAADPGERHNLLSELPIVSEYLRRSIVRLEKAARPKLDKHEADIDDELAEQLRALGYAQ